MKSCGQFCPVAKAAELFCERWTPLIIRDLAAGATRSSELQRGVPLMSPTLLSRRLRQLEAENVIERRRQQGARVWSYHLTYAGREFVPLVPRARRVGSALVAASAHGRRARCRIAALVARARGTAERIRPRTQRRGLEFTDQPQARRKWWFINENGAAKLCVKDPGFEVDLYLLTTVRDMIYLYRDDLSLTRALERGRLRALGMSRARRALRAWLKPHPLSKIRSARREDAAV